MCIRKQPVVIPIDWNHDLMALTIQSGMSVVASFVTILFTPHPPPPPTSGYCCRILAEAGEEERQQHMTRAMSVCRLLMKQQQDSRCFWIRAESAMNDQTTPLCHAKGMVCPAHAVERPSLNAPGNPARMAKELVLTSNLRNHSAACTAHVASQAGQQERRHGCKYSMADDGLAQRAACGHPACKRISLEHQAVAVH